MSWTIFLAGKLIKTYLCGNQLCGFAPNLTLIFAGGNEIHAAQTLVMLVLHFPVKMLNCLQQSAIPRSHLAIFSL